MTEGHAAAPVTEGRPAQSESDATAFLIHVGRALHTYGTSSDRLEEWLIEMSRRLDVPAHFFSMPTAIFASFGPTEAQRTSLIRVQPGEVNLTKLVQLDKVLNDVWDFKITPREGSMRVSEIVRAPLPYGTVLATLCHGLACAAAGRFFGGGPREILVAGTIGLAIGGLARAMRTGNTTARVFEPVAAMVAALLAFAADRWVGDLAVGVCTLAGLAVLLPGFTLTTAMNELAVRHLVAGTARFMSAVITLMMIGFGVAAGSKLAELYAVPHKGPATQPSELDDWTTYVALLLSPLAFTVLFRARPRDLPAIVGASVLAFGGARIGAIVVDGEALGSACGAFLVGAFSNLYARITKRPAAVTLTPGIMLLVPGSIGFRSIEFLAQDDTRTALETALRMTFIAISLVAGLLFANVAVRSGKIL